MAISHDNNPLIPTPGTKASDQQHPEAKHTSKYQLEKQQNSSSASSDQNKILNVAVYLSDEEHNKLPNAVLKQVLKEVEDQSSDSTNQKPNVEDKHQMENINEENGQLDNKMEDNGGEESDNQERDNNEEDGHQDENIGDAENEQDMLQDNPMAEFRDQQTPTFEDDDEDFQCMTPPRLSHRQSKIVKRRRKNDCKQPNPEKKKLLVGKTKSTTTLKGLSHKKKCLQQRSIEEIGVWVQCTDTTCTKWRYLTHITDPSQVPEVWTCELNTDPLYNKCEAAEQNYASLEFVFNQFTEGSVVWAKMAGYPWWPALVEEDPDLGICMELDDKNMPVLYHVVFLDQNITRAWLSKSCLKKYEDDMFCVGTPFSKGKGYRKQIEKAKARAQKALTMSIPERVKTFGFSHNFKGTIVESQSTESHDTFEFEDFQSPNSPSTKPCNDTSHLCVDEILASQATALLDDTQQVLANLDKSTCYQDSIGTEKTQINRSKQENKRMKQEKKERKAREKEEKRKLKMERKQTSKKSDSSVSEQTDVEKREKKTLQLNDKMDNKVCKQKEKEEKKMIKEKKKEVKRELKKKERDEKKKLKKQAKLNKREQLANLKEEKKMLNQLCKLDNTEEKNKVKKIEKEKRKEEKRKLKEQKKFEKKKQKELDKETKGQGSDLQSGQKRKLDETNASKSKQDKPVKKKLKKSGDVSKAYKSKQVTSCENPIKKPFDKVKSSFKPPSKVVPAFGISKPRGSFKPPTASCHTKLENKVTNNDIKNQKVVKDQSISSPDIDSKKIEKQPSSCTTNKGDDDLENKKNSDFAKQSSKENRVMIKEVSATVIEGDKKVNSDVVEGDGISKAKNKKPKFIVKRQKSSGILTSSRENANTQQPHGKKTISQNMSKLEDATNTKESTNMAQNGTESSSQETKVEKIAQCDNSMTYVEPIREGDKTEEELDTDSEDFCLDMNWPTEDSSDILELESISEKVDQLLDKSQSDSQPFDIVEE